MWDEEICWIGSGRPGQGIRPSATPEPVVSGTERGLSRVKVEGLLWLSTVGFSRIGRSHQVYSFTGKANKSYGSLPRELCNIGVRPWIERNSYQQNLYRKQFCASGFWQESGIEGCAGTSEANLFELFRD